MQDFKLVLDSRLWKIAQHVMPIDTQSAQHLLDPVEIGKRLYATRTALEMTQAAFADRLGMSQSTYALYETGKRMLPPRWAVAIALKFRVSTDWLYLGDASGIAYTLHEKIMGVLPRN